MNQVKWLFRVIVFIVIASAKSNAMDILVPGDQPDIQSGIDAATNGDRVFVADGTYTGAGNRNLNFDGKAITVESENGAAVCTVDCQDMGRGFIFQNGETTSSVLRGFTITNGYASGSWLSNLGAGIYCGNNSSPLIENCVINGNATEGEWGGAGGGIACYSASPEINACTISGNSCDNPQREGYGGGIFCYQSAPTITDCIFDSNTAELGGGIYCFDNSSPSIENCTITNNTGRWAGGGIICNTNSSPVISGGSISNNRSYYGGGIYNYLYGSPILTNIDFSNNVATGLGGGICFDGYCTSVISLCTFLGNQAYYRGGAISSINSQAVIGGSPGQENTFIGNWAGTGADLDSILSTGTPINAQYNIFEGNVLSDYTVSCPLHFDLSNCVSQLTMIEQDVYVSATGSDSNDGLSWGTAFATIQHAISVIQASEVTPITVHIGPGTYSPSVNGDRFPLPLRSDVTLKGEAIPEMVVLDSESSGSVIYGYYDESTILESLTLAGSDIYGVYLQGTTLAMRNCAISSNNWHGIYHYEADAFYENCIFDSNGYCGLCYTGIGDIAFEHCRFTNNSSGGIYCETGPVTVSNCVIADNSGSGINQHRSRGLLYVYDSIIANNTSNDGAGLHVRSAVINNTVITGNNAANNGGGVYAETGPVSFSNCLINGNTAARGGGIACTGRPMVQNCTITDNIASSQGGGIFVNASSSFQVENSILWNDQPSEIDVISANPILWYTCIQGGWTGSGGSNISLDPGFVTGPGGAFYLNNSPLSPCVNTGGTAACEICFDTTVDQICLNSLTACTDNVLDNGRVDMGYHHTPIILNADMSTDPGWIVSGGLWEYGQPNGNEGDPASGSTGSNVYGYNLNGAYDHNTMQHHLTTPSIDCTGFCNVTLNFQQWLGVEANTADHAVISISNDGGSSWNTVWENPDFTMDNPLTWTAVTYDISTWADAQADVRLRWTMGETDSANAYCGWNIDDVQVCGLGLLPEVPSMSVIGIILTLLAFSGLMGFRGMRRRQGK